MKKRILVVDAPGLMDETVAHRLLQAGFSVRLMVRDREKAGEY